jgi:hypothetical protein
MRRSVLATIAMTPLTLAVPSVDAAAQKRRIDTRLLGRWRSNKEKTVNLWRYPKPVTDEVRTKFEAIFGKFEIEFTRTRVRTTFDSDVRSYSYWVVASDSNSVVVAYPKDKEPDLQHFYFEQDGIYVPTGYNFEFFRRVGA